VLLPLHFSCSAEAAVKELITATGTEMQDHISSTGSMLLSLRPDFVQAVRDKYPGCEEILFFMFRFLALNLVTIIGKSQD
jgi:hypothetical protein